MPASFLHGVEIIELESGFRPIQTVASAIIGIVGSAPNADPDAFPLNRPTLINGSLAEAAKLGTGGTLPNAVDLILKQAGAAIVVVRVEHSTTANTLRANVIGGVNPDGTYTGIQALRAAKELTGLKPRILLAPGFTDSRTSGGVVTTTVSNGGSGYTTAPTVTFAAPPTGGVQAEGVATVAAGVVTGITLTKVGAGYSSAPSVSFSGGGGTGAVATCTIGTVRNAVGAELLSVANRLRAIALLDCPSTSDSDAVAYRNDWDGLGRIMVVEPKVLVDRGNTAPDAEPASSVWAGIIAKTDYDKGFWWSPSNKEIAGIVGIARPMDFATDDPACRANTLNSQQISVIIRQEGFRTWGNRTTSSDTKWAFLAERRTADMINDSIQAAMLPFVDRPLSKALIQDVLESINQYLRSLRSQGAIIEGNAWIDDTLNPTGQLANGQVVFSFDFKSSPPAERITIRSAVNNGYLEELI